MGLGGLGRALTGIQANTRAPLSIASSVTAVGGHRLMVAEAYSGRRGRDTVNYIRLRSLDR